MPLFKQHAMAFALALTASSFSSQSFAAEQDFLSRFEGSFSGGGRHQLRFGDDDRGLRETEVGQIWFEKPTGFPGIYPARILSDGEVVPLPRIIAERQIADIILRGPPGFILQTSTNISGPFEDVAESLNAASLRPSEPARFFRLKPERD